MVLDNFCRSFVHVVLRALQSPVSELGDLHLFEEITGKREDVKQGRISE